MRNYIVLIITNTESDLSKLKFDGFKILNVLSEEFKAFCKITNTTELLLSKFESEYEYLKQERFAIISENISESAIKKVYDVYNFILLMFPSNLCIEYILDYQAEEKFTRYLDNYEFEIKFNKEEFLYFDEIKLSEINKFISKYYKKYLEQDSLKFPIINYINAFESNLIHFSYVAFCISLESIIQGNQELMYRIRRTVSIICGYDEESSDVIFENMNKIYSFRSKIVHGEEFNEDLINKYLNYLECLVSKTIIELLVHEIEDIKVLGKQITKLGFGDRNKISSKWENYNFNLKIENTIYKKL